MQWKKALLCLLHLICYAITRVYFLTLCLLHDFVILYIAPRQYIHKNEYSFFVSMSLCESWRLKRHSCKVFILIFANSILTSVANVLLKLLHRNLLQEITKCLSFTKTFCFQSPYQFNKENVEHLYYGHFTQ